MSESVVTELTVEYTRKQLTKPASRSQHQQWFMKRTKQARRKSPTRMVRYVTSMSDTVSLINSCGRNKGKEGVLRWELVHTSPTRLHLSVWPASSWQSGGTEKGPQPLEKPQLYKSPII